MLSFSSCSVTQVNCRKHKLGAGFAQGGLHWFVRFGRFHVLPMLCIYRLSHRSFSLKMFFVSAVQPMTPQIQSIHWHEYIQYSFLRYMSLQRCEVSSKGFAEHVTPAGCQSEKSSWVFTQALSKQPDAPSWSDKWAIALIPTKSSRQRQIAGKVVEEFVHTTEGPCSNNGKKQDSKGAMQAPVAAIQIRLQTLLTEEGHPRKRPGAGSLAP